MTHAKVWATIVLFLAAAGAASAAEPRLSVTEPRLAGITEPRGTNVTEPPTSRSYTVDPAGVTRYGPAYRYSQAGWIVVHVEGAPYERGYQHGRLLAEEIVDYIGALAKARSPAAPNEAWSAMRTLANALFLRRYDAEYLEEMKGIADGASAAGAKFADHPLDLVDLVAVNSFIEIEFLDAALHATPTGLEGRRFEQPHDVNGRPATEDHCSAFAATGPATADGGIVFGHITMFNLYHVRHFNVWLDLKPAAGHRVSMQTYPGGIQSGLDYYINDAGLLLSETTIQQTPFNAEGQALCARVRRAAQYADSIDKAIEMLRGQNNGLYSNEWMLGDVNSGEIAMFELGTAQSHVWRSSKNQWPGGTKGFYWGCNNPKDPALRRETLASVADRPANLQLAPSERDICWQRLFTKHDRKINEAFGFEAFTTPPVAGFHSCDAKFTTTKLAKSMKTWALFGPPLGKTWEATPDESKRNPDIQPLVSNDWTLIGVEPPSKPETKSLAVDLPLFQEDPKRPTDKLPVAQPVWRGTLLPETDADIWLASAFGEYEHVVSLDRALHKQAKAGKLDRAAEDEIQLALFRYRSKWVAAARRLGHDLPLETVKFDWTSHDWYDIAVGKGVMLLDSLRHEIGADAFDGALDAFGTAHAGQAVSTAEFQAALAKVAGHSLDASMDGWLKKAQNLDRLEHYWAIDSFQGEPNQTLIVYGTVADRRAQREAAERLQAQLLRRDGNITVPIKSDIEVAEADLKAAHVLLVGRPGTNAVAERLVSGLPVAFGADSFSVRGETYAHADSACIAAGPNPLNPRFSVVAFAGLGARATWQCVQRPLDTSCEVLIFPARQRAHGLCIVSGKGEISVR